MDKDIVVSIQLLAAAYGIRFNQIALEVYGNALSQYSSKLVAYVVKHWIRTQKEPPTISELLVNCEIADGWEKLVR